MGDVLLSSIIEVFSLKLLTEVKDIDSKKILVPELSRPGVELLGYYQYNDLKRIVLLGNKETFFISNLDIEKRKQCYEYLTNPITPCIIVTQGADCDPLLLEIANRKDFPIFQAKQATSLIQVEMINYLSELLAPMVSIHGTLMQIYSTGILLVGKSGIGKSEIALELLRKGHGLVADDRVNIISKRMKLYGSAPKNIERFMEIRGIGIFEITKIFGINSFVPSTRIDFVIKLVEDEKEIKRFIKEYETTTFLGLSLPTIEIPVLPGRNMSEIVEIAVTLLKLKKDGYEAMKEFEERIYGKHD